jgi:hypothetical protein
MSLRRAFAASAAAFALAAAAARAQPYEPMLLASPLGEMCTQCTAALACTPAPGAEEAAAIYLFPVKTVWQQIMTIPTYLPFIGKPAVDRRPVVVHQPAESETGVDGEAALNFGAGSVRAAGAEINRRDGTWMRQDGRAIGRCVPAGRNLAEARAALRQAQP